jgi:hypothetical protein
MSSGDTNDSVYIQKLFTSRDNFTQGNVQEAQANAASYVGQEGRIWWNPVYNAFYYSNGNTPGGIMIGSGSNAISNISVADQGSVLTFNVESFNFVGDGVVASNVGNAVTITIPGSNVTNALIVSQYTYGNISNSVPNVSGLLFDTTTGFNVTDLGNGNALITLGSSFKTWEVDGQTSLVAVGEDTVQFVDGNNIVITTNALSTPQQIQFSLSDNVSVTGNITAANFIGNITANITVPGANTQVIFNDNGSADATAGFTFNKTSNLVTVGGNVSAVGFVGNGAGLANVMADRGLDTNNWDVLTQMGVYLVNRTSWAGTVGTPLDSQIFIGVLEVVNATDTALSQIFYPATVSEDVKIQWTRTYWSGSWTGWILMTNSGQVIVGGDF